MANLNYTQSRNHTVEQTFLAHLEPKVGDVVLALDYRPGSTTMSIGMLIGIDYNAGPEFGKFKVKSLEWQDDVQPMHWEQAYKIPEGLVTLKRMTNHQLARWCSLGRGEVCVDGLVSTTYSYKLIAAQELVRPDVKIRSWGSNAWIDPIDFKAQYEGHSI